jgi:hypothetical protein
MAQSVDSLLTVSAVMRLLSCVYTYIHVVLSGTVERNLMHSQSWCKDSLLCVLSWRCPLWVQQAPSPSPCLLHLGCCGQRQVINSWRRLSPHGHSIEREGVFIEENKGISSTLQNLRSEQHICSGEGINDRWRIQLRMVRFVQFGETHGRQYGHIPITLFI